MKPRYFWIEVGLGVVCMVGVLRPASAQGRKEVAVDGQVRVGVHKLKLESGSLYQIEVKGKGFRPTVNLREGSFASVMSLGKDGNTFVGVFIPRRSDEYTLTVLPNTFNPPEGLLDYRLRLRRITIEETPFLTKQDKLTPEDAKYMNAGVFSRKHFKASPFNIPRFGVSWESVMDYFLFFVRGKDASPTTKAETRSAKNDAVRSGVF